MGLSALSLFGAAAHHNGGALRRKGSPVAERAKGTGLCMESQRALERVQELNRPVLGPGRRGRQGRLNGRPPREGARPKAGSE